MTVALRASTRALHQRLQWISWRRTRAPRHNEAPSFLFCQIVDIFSFIWLYAKTQSSTAFKLPWMVWDCFPRRRPLVCRRFDERYVARLREFDGCRIVPFLKNGGKTNFGRSMWRMTVRLCKVSVRNGTTNVLGRQR